MNTLKDQHDAAIKLVPNEAWERVINEYKSIILNQLQENGGTPTEAYHFIRVGMINEIQTAIMMIGAATYELEIERKKKK